MLIGADNWPVEVAPNPDRSVSLPVHQIALVVNGVHLLENMKLDQLAQRRLGHPRRPEASDKRWTCRTARRPPAGNDLEFQDDRA